MLSAVAARKARHNQGQRRSSAGFLSGSSDEDEANDLAAQQRSNLPQAGAVEEQAPAPTIHQLRLSTWYPVNDESLFALETEHLASWNIPSLLPARLVLLRRFDKLALVGTYRLTVVFGTVLLAGTPLTSSTGTHNVFAPWSSPLPLIECDEGNDVQRRTQPSPFQEFLRNAHAAVVIQELKTGIQGLGHVCKTFAGVFEVPRRAMAGHASLGLAGINYVSDYSRFA